MLKMVMWSCNIRFSCINFQLWLNIEQWDYVPWLTDGAGAVVAVHDPGTYPAPEDQGVSLQPGWQTDVAVTLVRRTACECYT